MNARTAITLAGVLSVLAAGSSWADEATALDARLAKGEVVVELIPVEGVAQPALKMWALLDAAPEDVFAIIDNCSGYAAVLPRIASATEVSRTGEESVCRWVVATPFPLKNMATEVAATSTHSDHMWVRDFKQTHGDFLRNEGRWQLTRFGGDPHKTRLEYRLVVSIDIMLPDSFVQSGQRGAMNDLVKNLRKRIETDRKR